MRRGVVIATAAMVLCGAVNAFGGTGISQVIKLVEAKYSTHHHGVPALWLAKPFLVGSGVRGLKMATFENLSIPADDMYQLKRQVSEALGPDWQPFVETFSKHDGEWSAIYLQTSGKAMQLLIASDDHEEFTIVQIKLSEKAMHDWIDEPVQHAKYSAIRSKDDGR